MARKPLAQRVQGNSPAARALLKKALANPGLRSKLPEKYLSPEQRTTRRTNLRLRAPITAGSTTTERDLAHQAQAAMDVKYGPLEAQQRQQVGEAQTWQRDVGSYYDQYRQQLAAHQQAVADTGAQASAQLQGTLGGITGLAGADLTQLNQAATKDAAARGATPGDLAQMASNATATRQALVGSFAAQQAAQNQANTGYASGLSQVVAPAQKLQGVAQAAGRVRQAREREAATARERGAADIGFREEARGAEAKNVLARQIAGVSATTKAAAQAETHRHNVAGESAADARIQAAKDKSAADATARGATPNKYGITTERWNSMSQADRQKVIRDFSAGKGKGGGKGGAKGPDWVTPNESGAGMTQAGQLKGLAQKAITGTPFIQGHEKQPPIKDRWAAQRKIQEFAGKDLKSPALLNAAVDAIYDKHLSANTIKMLIQAGYKPSQVASTLGVPTSGQFKKSHPNPTPTNTRVYRRGRASQPQGHY